MNWIFVLILFVCMISMTSCGKKKEKAASPESDITIMNAGDKYGEVLGGAMKKARKMDVILPLKQLIDSFYAEKGKYPLSLQELVDESYIKQLPKLPSDMRFVYDSSKGSLSIEAKQ